MTKAELQTEMNRLRKENRALKEKIKQMGELNRQAFQLQHKAEITIIELYEDMRDES